MSASPVADRFDGARADAAVRRMLAPGRRLRRALLNTAILLVVGIVVGRMALAFYGQTLIKKALVAEEGALHHEGLRLRLRALTFTRLAAWPFLTRGDRATYAGQLMQVAQAYVPVGSLTNALSTITQAVAYAKTAGDDELLAGARTIDAGLRNDFDPDGARAAYLDAFDLYGRHRDLSADPWIHFRLTDCAMANRDFKGALTEISRAERLAPNEHTIAVKKAAVLLALGRADDALAIMNPDLLSRVGRQNLPPRQETSLRADPGYLLAPSENESLEMFFQLEADLMLRLGFADKASTAVFAFRPLVGSESMANPANLAAYYARLGWSRELEGNRDKSIDAYILSINWLEENRRRLPAELRARFFAKDVYTLPYRHLTAILARMPLEASTTAALRPYGRTNLEAALYFAEATKARTFMEQVAHREQPSAAGVAADVRAREDALLAQRAAGQRALEAAIAEGGFKPLTDDGKAWHFADPSPALVEAERQLSGINSAWQTFEDDLYRRAPRYAALKYPRPVPLSQVPIADDETIIEFALSDLETVAFVLDGSTHREVVMLPTTGSRVRELVADYLAPLRVAHLSPKDDEGTGLYNELLAPVLQRIPAGRRLVVVPDGVLWTLPFEILPVGSSGKRVADTWTLTYAPSLAILALNRLSAAPAPTRPFFGVGDVRFGSDSAQQRDGMTLRGVYIDRAQYLFPPLPETRREVERAAIFFGVAPEAPDVLLGAEATETRLKRTRLTDYRIVHLATHGVANTDLAFVREPALLFGRDGDNDGILTASEAANLSLGAGTVVLAACNTGLGEDLGGEGVMSLARAFQHAGARTVVMSLWSVPSEATETLFAAFYRGMQSGHGAADSLRAARLEVRARHPEPFYWGAFTIVGEAR